MNKSEQIVNKVEIEVSSFLGEIEMDILAEILDLSASLHLITWQITPKPLSISFVVASTTRSACCPLCQMPSRKIHSHYERILSDLNWGIYQVNWQLWVKKFFCKNENCPRQVFTERLPQIVMPYARKTQRLISQSCQIAMALGGKAGERLSHHLNYRVSRQTLLSLIYRLPLKEITDVKVVGVDDWAYRKGQSYGTILVDERETSAPCLTQRSRSSNPKRMVKTIPNHQDRLTRSLKNL